MNEEQIACLRDWFERVNRVMRGEAHEDVDAGGWPFWSYSAVAVKELDWQAPSAAGGNADDDTDRWGDPLPNTVRFPCSYNLREGIPLKNDPEDLCGDDGTSVGRKAYVSLSALEATLPDDGAGDDDWPDTTEVLADEDIVLPDPETGGAPEPEFTPEQMAFASRIMAAWKIGRARTRFRRLDKILDDIEQAGDARLWIKARLYFGRQQPGFNAYRKEKKVRGRKPKGGRLLDRLLEKTAPR